MTGTHVFAALNKSEITLEKWALLIGKLPPGLHENILRYHRWQDRQATLLGKLLLDHGLKKLGIVADLAFLQTDKYKRPSLPLSMDFNISHSGEYVVCAIAAQRIGIDIEMIRPVNPQEFRSVLTEKEFKMLSEMEKPEDLFFRIWSKKEAAIKALGKGFSADLKQTEALGDVLYLENNRWLLTEIFIDDNYRCFLASAKPPGEIRIDLVSLPEE